MSRQNKVNPDHYTQGGRLSPDDLARERQKQLTGGLRPSHKNRPLPPWMLGTEAPEAPAVSVEEPTPEADRPEGSTVDADVDERPAVAPPRRAAKKAKRRTAAKKATRPAAAKRRPAPRSARARTAKAATSRPKKTATARAAAKKTAARSRTSRSATARAAGSRARTTRARSAKKR